MTYFIWLFAGLILGTILWFTFEYIGRNYWDLNFLMESIAIAMTSSGGVIATIANLEEHAQIFANTGILILSAAFMFSMFLLTLKRKIKINESIARRLS